MIKGTNVLQTSAGEYLAPKVKVFVIKKRRVLCASLEGSGSNGDNGDDGNDENETFF